VLLGGFGVSGVALEGEGVRRVGSATVSGYDETTGVIQTTGSSACFGDSGGAVLDAASGMAVGVIGEVGGAEGGSFCDVGTSFAVTFANEQVRRLVSKACAREGGCTRERGSAEDAGISQSSDGDAAADAPDADVSRDAGTEPWPAKPAQAQGGCSVSTMPLRPHWVWVVGTLVGLRRPGQRVRRRA
jgi:hypothetical protein